MRGFFSVAACGVLLGGLLLSTNANATVTYRDSASVQFTFAPVLSMTISADGFIINDLVPGTSSISNTVTTTVTTNSNFGYQLSATVGNSTYNSSDLISSAGNKRFSMISSGTSLTSGTWGYTLDSGTTYGGLNTYIPTVLKTTAGPTGDLGDATPMQIGAYATADQKPDVYNNVVNFIVLSNVEPPTPTKLYLQDVTSDICTTTPTIAYDIRDEQEYTIQKLADENCWMMTNLNLGDITNHPLVVSKLDYSNTNLPDDSTREIAASTFNGWKKTFGSRSRTSAELIPISGTDSTSQTPYGTLYNYCAASAGTICSSSNKNNATYDICPKGWRLPTGSTSGEFKALYDNEAYNTLAKMRAPISSGGAAFALAGSFIDPPINQGIYGDYWSSTRSDSVMHSLFLNTSYVYFDTSDRSHGLSVRCILK